MSKSRWKNLKPRRRPPLLNQKPQASDAIVASSNPNQLVPSGIELTPISPQIIQSVKDLLAARGVDVEVILD